jgi:hypothetical protein
MPATNIVRAKLVSHMSPWSTREVPKRRLERGGGRWKTGLSRPSRHCGTLMQ